MALTNPDAVVTEQNLSDYYQGIYPYLGGGGSATPGSLTNPNDIVTEERLSEFYQGIRPYLGAISTQPKPEPLLAPTKVYEVIGSGTTIGLPFSHQEVVSSDGTYLVFVNSRTTSCSSSIICTGTEKYYSICNSDAYSAGKIGIYSCENGDIISLSLGGAASSVAIYYAVIININKTDFSNISLEAGGCSHTNYSITGSNNGNKLAFATLNSDPSDASNYLSITTTSSDYQSNEYENTNGKYSKTIAMNCILDEADTISLIGTSSTAYNTVGLFIFSFA